jgi:hypothetical protein
MSKVNVEEKRKMTQTPTKSEIIKKAVEMWRVDQFKSGSMQLAQLNPEVEELREGGYLSAAQSELMMSLKRKHAEYKEYAEHMKNFTDFQFDIKEAMQTTTFISGSRGVGKSDIAMQIVDQLSNDGVICIAFDSSLDWLKRSSIAQYITVKPYTDLQIPEQNTIINMSMLTPNEQQRTIETFCKKLFESQINNITNRYYLIFEESQLYFPLNSIRAKRYQNSARVLTVGRNFGISLCAISQFPALCDKELIKNAQQIYVGCTSEPNTLAYWKAMIGKSAHQLKDLQNGEFVYYCRNKLGKIQIEPYENITTKTRIAIPEPTFEKIPQIPKQSNIVFNLLKLAVIVFFAILLLSTMPK